jgi:PAS domain S-box-containing protein
LTTAPVDNSTLRIPTGIPSGAPGRHEADLRVEVSEESLRLAAEAAEVGTWDLDLITDVLTWSDRTRAMFGVSMDAPVSMADFYGGLHPDDFEATVAAFASAINPAIRATYDVEYRTIGKDDGVTRWVAAKGKGLFAEGVCRRAIGTAIDITARKLAAMRQTFVLNLMDRLRRLTSPDDILESAVQALGDQLRASRVGYGQIQADGETVVLATCYANGVEALNGAFPLEAFGAHDIDRQRRGLTVAVDDVSADPRHDLTTWDAIEARAYVSVPLLRNGQLRATLYVNHRDPHDWSQEEIRLIEEVAGRTWDALERARAEEALKQLNASLERLVESRTHERDRIWRIAPVVMVVSDAEGILLEANPAWTRVLGWSEDETIGHDVMEFVAPEDRAAGAAGMAQLFAGQAVSEYQLTFLTKAGDRRRIAWTTVPENDRLYGHGRDVTEQVAAEERLRQSQKMEAVGQLTGGIAHDFNNMLQAVTGGITLARRRFEAGKSEEAFQCLDLAVQAADRTTTLTRRLLAFGRRQALDPKAVALDDLILGMEGLIQRTLGPEVRLEVRLKDRCWPVRCDPNQLESALLNLAINARDAMASAVGRLLIETAHVAIDDTAIGDWEGAAPGDYVRLTVSDTGIGMTPHVLAHAFEPFFTTKPHGQGTGLGLSQLYGFVRQSRGIVRLESEVAVGTSVHLYLPRYEEVASRDAASSPTERRQKPSREGEAVGTVLLVEDERTVRDFAAQALRELGYNVIEAGDGPTGLSALHEALRDPSVGGLDLLVTDVGLPGGLNGRQLADAARELDPNLPVLLITGYAGDTNETRGRLGFRMEILLKPFELDVLAERVQAIIRRVKSFTK